MFMARSASVPSRRSTRTKFPSPPSSQMITVPEWVTVRLSGLSSTAASVDWKIKWSSPLWGSRRQI